MDVCQNPNSMLIFVLVYKSCKCTQITLIFLNNKMLFGGDSCGFEDSDSEKKICDPRWWVMLIFSKMIDIGLNKLDIYAIFSHCFRCKLSMESGIGIINALFFFFKKIKYSFFAYIFFLDHF